MLVEVHITEQLSPPDREVLRLIKQYLSDSKIIDDAVLKPSSYEPRKIVAQLKDGVGLQSTEPGQLVVRWFTNNDFSIQYTIKKEASDWRCRWDRHLNCTHTRTHFHYPPSGNIIEDLSIESEHPIDVIMAVLTAIVE